MINTSLDHFISDHADNDGLDISFLTTAEKKELFACFIDDKDVTELIQNTIDQILYERYIEAQEARGLRCAEDNVTGEALWVAR